MADGETYDILTLTTEIVSSYVGNSAHLKAEEIPDLIRSVRAALSEDGAPVAPAEPETVKATKAQITKSIQPHGLTSFVDGKVYKTLKRHLTRHGHDMASYKAAYGLPADYPSVAPDYSAARSAMAKSLGLGNQGRGRAKAAAPVAKPARKKAAAPVEA
jgi:predicted transcriptional regulator